MMDPMSAAIQRIIQSHYGGNLQDPRAQMMMGRLTRDPSANAKITTQLYLRRLAQQAALGQ